MAVGLRRVRLSLGMFWRFSLVKFRYVLLSSVELRRLSLVAASLVVV